MQFFVCTAFANSKHVEWYFNMAAKQSLLIEKLKLEERDKLNNSWIWNLFPFENEIP